MDISLNLIDLQYLTNPGQLMKIMQKKEIRNPSVKDLDFYKKRILQFTKDMLRGGEKGSAKVNKSFVNYANICIDHFQFVDKMEMIQAEYKDIKAPVESDKPFNMETSNDFMLRKKNLQRPKITDNIKIKSTKVIKPIIIPKKRIFNLKDPNFREKGLKKKNINNT